MKANMRRNYSRQWTTAGSRPMDYNLHALTLAELLKLYQAVGRELFTRYWMGLVVLFWVVLVWTDYATDKYISRLFRCICNALKGKKK